MISVVALGHLRAEQIQELQKYFAAVEAIDAHLPRDAALGDQGAELNRLIAAAGSPWVLFLREREFVDFDLAAEIARATTESPRAWGFRLKTQSIYDGSALMLDRSAGEIRLVHQRHARFREGELKVEGTVIRLDQPLRAVTFETSAQHAEFLRARGVPHSLLRRLLLFLRNVIATGAWRSRATLRYLWLEAGYDLGGEASGHPSSGR